MDSAKNKSAKPKKAKKITASYLHNAGLYYLQRFSASRQQFRTVMLRKVKKSCLEHKDQNYEDCAAMVEDTIGTFERAGLLNDESYAQGVVASLRRAGKSKKEILMKMRARGLAPDLALEKLELHDLQNPENGDTVAALKLLRRKKTGPFDMGKKHPPEKTLASLARAGFSYDTAQHVLNLKRKEAEEILKS